jgi:hypothetical protein
VSLNNRMVLNDDSGRAWKKALMTCFKVKGKNCPCAGHKGVQGEQRYSPTDS